MSSLSRPEISANSEYNRQHRHRFATLMGIRVALRNSLTRKPRAFPLNQQYRWAWYILIESFYDRNSITRIALDSEVQRQAYEAYELRITKYMRFWLAFSTKFPQLNWFTEESSRRKAIPRKSNIKSSESETKARKGKRKTKRKSQY